jgi:hypothetical protein
MKNTTISRAVASLLLSCGGALHAEGNPAETPKVFLGMCDASAAAAIDAERFIVADDEDNVLRVYSRDGGPSLSETDISEFLGNQGKKKAKEADIEAAAQLGRQVFWIASHGRNAKGKNAPERQRLFATGIEIVSHEVRVQPIGQAYRSLLDDLTKQSDLEKYQLRAAAELAPKAPGGLNIEGLAATSNGELLIGFRSPLYEGRALIVPLLNPQETIRGAGAKFGKAMELDLHGSGIRSIERVGQQYVIIAGSAQDAQEPSRLYRWDGTGKPKLVPNVTLRGLNPEGIAFHPGGSGGDYFLLSDDGTREVAGQDCKDLRTPADKSFRGRSVSF